MQRIVFIMGVVLLILIEVTLCRAQMVCDGNDDGRVTVAELVQGVNNALDSPPDCHEGCAETCFGTDGTDCPCASCQEFIVFDGVRCDVSLCYESDEQVRPCWDHFRAAHPNACHAAIPLGVAQELTHSMLWLSRGVK